MIYKSLLAAEKFMPEIHLKQPGFTYNGCGPFTKNKERIRRFKEREGTKYIYKHEIDKAYFQHDVAYANFKNFTRRTASDIILLDKAFNFAKNPKYGGYQRGLASMVYKSFDKKSSVGDIKSMPNQQLAYELHKTIIKTFKRRKVYSSFNNNIWGADLADIQLISKYN